MKTILKNKYLILLVVSVCLIILLFFTTFFSFYQVDGVSMERILKNNDEIVAHHLFSIKRNNVYIIKYKDDYLIKRVVGIPGDRIYAINGSLFCNGKEEKLKYENVTYDIPEFVVPNDHYFVLGDNRINSIDSRDPTVGFIPRENIIAEFFIRTKKKFGFLEKAVE